MTTQEPGKAQQLTPLQKIREMLDLLCQEKIDSALFKAGLAPIRQSLNRSYENMQRVSFPEEFDQGQQLLRQSIEAFEALSQALAQIESLEPPLENDKVQSSWTQLEQAYLRLEELFRETRSARMSR